MLVECLWLESLGESWFLSRLMNHRGEFTEGISQEPHRCLAQHPGGLLREPWFHFYWKKTARNQLGLKNLTPRTNKPYPSETKWCV